ncbi:hypothetical protein EDB85DRAFT_2299349 [Lactarius pseudohatsudake]|nr:hypothetical protein EDB85DRAFT_2299349 [Lactarius pseudohatsudake]
METANLLPHIHHAWDAIQLNDGNVIPGIAFGTQGIGNVRIQSTRLFPSEFSHIGQYGLSSIDSFAADLITSRHCSRLPQRRRGRDGRAGRATGKTGDIFITTKYSGLTDLIAKLPFRTVSRNTLDLYLIHHSECPPSQTSDGLG